MQQMMSSLTNKTFVIVGAAGFVGKAITEELKNFGTTLVLIDKDLATINLWDEKVSNDNKSKSEFFQCDLEFSDERKRVFSKVRDTHPKIHGIVNCAAFVGDSNLPGWSVPFCEQSISTWRRAIEVNVTSVFEVCQVLAPSLFRANGSSIVNISSIYGEKGPRWSLYEGTSMGSPAAYGVSKAGLIQLTRWLSTTLAPQIRVNSIVAGGIQRNQPQKFIDRYCRDVPLERMAKEGDLVGPVLFLLSEMSQYITGETLHVDGGRGAW